VPLLAFNFKRSNIHSLNCSSMIRKLRFYILIYSSIFERLFCASSRDSTGDSLTDKTTSLSGTYICGRAGME
jgi:hypothetical protein